MDWWLRGPIPRVALGVAPAVALEVALGVAPMNCQLLAQSELQVTGLLISTIL